VHPASSGAQEERSVPQMGSFVVHFGPAVAQEPMLQSDMPACIEARPKKGSKRKSAANPKRGEAGKNCPLLRYQVADSGSPSPAGTTDNSPAIHRWVKGPWNPSPAGAKETE
jgi:hypothetical protein